MPISDHTHTHTHLLSSIAFIQFSVGIWLFGVALTRRTRRSRCACSSGLHGGRTFQVLVVHVTVVADLSLNLAYHDLVRCLPGREASLRSACKEEERKKRAKIKRQVSSFSWEKLCLTFHNCYHGFKVVESCFRWCSRPTYGGKDGSVHHAFNHSSHKRAHRPPSRTVLPSHRENINLKRTKSTPFLSLYTPYVTLSRNYLPNRYTRRYSPWAPLPEDAAAQCSHRVFGSALLVQYH